MGLLCCGVNEMEEPNHEVYKEESYGIKWLRLAFLFIIFDILIAKRKEAHNEDSWD